VQTVTDAEVDRLIIETYPLLLQNYLDQRSAVSAGHLVEVAFEDLLREPQAEMIRIYEALDLGEVPDAIARALDAQPDYTPHSYATPPELEQKLRKSWAFSFSEWGRNA
jgi:RecB family exonuclease